MRGYQHDMYTTHELCVLKSLPYCARACNNNSRLYYTDKFDQS